MDTTNKKKIMKSVKNNVFKKNGTPKYDYMFKKEKWYIIYFKTKFILFTL